MKKLLSGLTAGMLVLAINGFAVAQDKPARDQSETQQNAPATQQDTQPQPGQSGDLSAKEQEYLVALTKCESLSGGEKTKCIEAAKKKFGQM